MTNKQPDYIADNNPDGPGLKPARSLGVLHIAVMFVIVLLIIAFIIMRPSNDTQPSELIRTNGDLSAGMYVENENLQLVDSYDDGDTVIIGVELEGNQQNNFRITVNDRGGSPIFDEQAQLDTDEQNLFRIGELVTGQYAATITESFSRSQVLVIPFQVGTPAVQPIVPGQ